MQDSKNQAQERILKLFAVREEDLKQLCQTMGVKSLAVFGSVVHGSFKTGHSDIDFLVEFESISVDRFFDFLDGLKNLFKYENVDLITVAALKNTVIRQEIMSSRENIYRAA